MHPNPAVLVRWRDRTLSDTEAEVIRVHLETCEECEKTMQTITRNVPTFDEAWVRKRLNEVAARTHWPTRDDLVDYFLDDLSSAETRRAIEVHVHGCATCREIVRDLEVGATQLQRADPLGQSVLIRQSPQTTSASTTRGLTWLEALHTLLRPAAWPAWSLATVAAAGLFALGFLLRPVVWPTGESARVGLVAQLEKPALPREPDGSLALGLGATTARPEARALLEEALAFYDAADFADRALPKLEQAVKVDPAFEQARFWLGICHLLKGDSGAGLPQLEEAVRLAPGNVTYQHYLVWGYLTAGHYRKALEAQTRLLIRR